MLIEQARDAVLRYFSASADEYAVIFTPNATGACRLVGEAYPFWHQPRLVLTADNHNAVHGLREFARPLGATVSYVGFSPADLRVTDTDISAALGHGALQPGKSPGRDRRRGLFAYPAQSNFSGVQHPLTWVDQAQAAGWDVLLDAAAFVPTSRLDLGAVKPEFVTLSWYKMFGYPTGIGCLLARRDALARLRRPWFSGGTVWGASVQDGFHRLADDETAFEDGTVNFLSIPDVTTGLDWISGIGIDLIHRRVGYLTGWLLGRLARLKHGNGAPLVRLYGPADGEARGGTVAFNFLDPNGALVDERAVARDASAAGISVRTGCFCNPGAWEQAFGLTGQVVRGTRWRPLPPPNVPTVDDYLKPHRPAHRRRRPGVTRTDVRHPRRRAIPRLRRADLPRPGALQPRAAAAAALLTGRGMCVFPPLTYPLKSCSILQKETKMPAWFWLNVPAEVLFFLAMSGIPLWMVLKKPAEPIPDHRPDPGPSAPACRPELTGWHAR